MLLVAAIMALAFQGSRGLWDPDEGRYSNVALNMVDSGDYLVPHRHHESLHLTKPPVTYWAMAASVQAFGRNEWALRLPMALAFLGTVCLVYRLGRLATPERPWLPALLYLGSPLPFLAANAITTDTVLTLFETMAVLAYMVFRFDNGSRRWLDGMWLVFGIAFMVKGPPALLPLAAIVAFEAWRGRPRDLLRPWGLLAFVLVAFSWFAWISHRYTGLIDYFLGHEVVDRVSGAGMDRHPEWYGPLLIYLPTLLLGALPWLPMAIWRRWFHPGTGDPAALDRFLWCWLLLPLAVFCLARSRLPFYLLPLFIPLSLLMARSFSTVALGTAARLAVAAWLLVLVAVKLVVAQAPSDQDARAYGLALRPLLPSQPREVVFVEGKARYGLHLYTGAEIERISIDALGPRPLSDAAFDDSLEHELLEAEVGRYFIVPGQHESRFLAAASALGNQPRRLGGIDGDVVFELQQ